MSKRVADKELTDRNWQDEDEPEEAGEFAKAPQDVIKQRVIKTAKRRHIPNSNSEEKPSLFAGFGGFGGDKTVNLGVQPTMSLPKIKVTNTDSKPLLAFTQKSEETINDTNGSKNISFLPSSSSDEKKLQSPSKEFQVTPMGESIFTSSSNPFSKTESPQSNDNITDAAFLRKLKKLNESVIKFAKEHIDKNPFVILTNVFNDYEKHIERLKAEKPEQSTENSIPQFGQAKCPEVLSKDMEVKVADKADAKPFSFGASSSVSTNPFGSKTGAFSFKPTTSAADSTQPPNTGGFSFKPSTTSAAPSLFGKPVGGTSFSGFGTLVGKPAAPFDSTKTATSETAESAEAAEDDTPPQPEKVDHIEKGALYHIKCKLFLKSGSDWNEKGLGIANLTSCNGKVQLLVRNDTTMGTVVLNTLLYESIPITRSGRNGIMIVVSDADMKSETYLCRVNKDKVEEFYDKLVEYKQGAPAEDD